ncbi:MAG TPA: hypothetical protein PK251_05110 [Candidatus Latescibacteria bacterium]|nr:hypothetical protein [Candidatus Latescibacterota bacterium]HOS64120.1 hypothetical protein [Candidatus Latescibacterota bacterium]HPK75693.1 hypothetical protein [Candidatus Latescibacterota bacterium]
MNINEIRTACSQYRVVLEPDENTPEWWAGAPSVTRGDNGEFFLAARMREGKSPRGRRGYEVRILSSADGASFTPVNHIARDAAGVIGFERPALVRDPHSGAYRLYGCCAFEDGWGIIRFQDAAHPKDIDPAKWQVVLKAENPADGFNHTVGYKDPFIFWDRDKWRMFVIGYDRVERAYQFVSADGTKWEPASDRPALENTGWHSFFTRPACVLPLSVGYLLVYEGSTILWRDPDYNIATGLAYSPDMETFIDLTPDEPLLKSTTAGPYHTWRYSHWVHVGEEVYVYFEAARPNATNEIRLATFKEGR